MSRSQTYLAYAAIPVVVVFFVVMGLWLEGGTKRPAADFALPVAAGPGADAGDRIRMADLRGRVVLLDFWASWCAPCRQTIPALNRIRADLGPERLSVVGVNVETGLDAGELAAAHGAFGAAFPTVQDRDGALQEAYRIQSLPTLVVIDAAGQVRAVHVGVPDEERLGEELTELLGEAP